MLVFCESSTTKDSFKVALKVFIGSTEVVRESTETHVHLLYKVKSISREIVIILH